jgi:hypothetical protein
MSLDHNSDPKSRASSGLVIAVIITSNVVKNTAIRRMSIPLQNVMDPCMGYYGGRIRDM